jgi:hypothetical protein
MITIDEFKNLLKESTISIINDINEIKSQIGTIGSQIGIISGQIGTIQFQQGNIFENIILRKEIKEEFGKEFSKRFIIKSLLDVSKYFSKKDFEDRMENALQLSKNLQNIYPDFLKWIAKELNMDQEKKEKLDFSLFKDKDIETCIDKNVMRQIISRIIEYDAINNEDKIQHFCYSGIGLIVLIWETFKNCNIDFKYLVTTVELNCRGKMDIATRNGFPFDISMGEVKLNEKEGDMEAFQLYISLNLISEAFDILTSKKNKYVLKGYIFSCKKIEDDVLFEISSKYKFDEHRSLSFISIAYK